MSEPNILPTETKRQAAAIARALKAQGTPPTKVSREFYADDGAIVIVRCDGPMDDPDRHLEATDALLASLAGQVDANATVIRRNGSLIAILPAARGFADKSDLTARRYAGGGHV